MFAKNKMDSNNAASQTQTPSSIRPTITFESLTFSDGKTISLDPNDIVLFVGPNNAGKSLALRELEEQIGPPTKGKVIASAKMRRTGMVDDLRKLVEKHSRIVDAPGTPRYQGGGWVTYVHTLQHSWENDQRSLRRLFCRRIPTESRITDSNAQGAIPLLTELPLHPIHILYKNDEIENEMSGYFREAFGEDLTLFRLGGGSWPLLVGGRPLIRAGEDRISSAYNERLLAATVPLQEQGDGMRSFASVILHLLASDAPSILLLDEPEAFLHPPQARLLGEFIAREKPSGAQLFVATHSPDVLQGLLNVGRDHLRLVRLQRDGRVNRVKELDKARAAEIACDPVMKFTSVLSGIFHQRVIICESDADCMFYSAVLDIPAVHGSTHPDVLFVQAGGKHRMAALAETLRELDVNVDVIADFDVLNDEKVLERLVNALGGNWDAVKADALPLKLAIEQHKPWLTANEVAKGIRRILDEIPPVSEFPRNLRNDIEAIFRKASPWDAIKSAGEAAVPSGQATKHYKRLQPLCSGFGLWMVPVGELEGFCRAEGGHGPAWVQRVIGNRDLANDPDLASARAFVSSIWSRVSS